MSPTNLMATLTTRNLYVKICLFDGIHVNFFVNYIKRVVVDCDLFVKDTILTFSLIEYIQIQSQGSDDRVDIKYNNK